MNLLCQCGVYFFIGCYIDYLFRAFSLSIVDRCGMVTINFSFSIIIGSGAKPPPLRATRNIKYDAGSLSFPKLKMR